MLPAGCLPPLLPDVHDEERARAARLLPGRVEELVEDDTGPEPLAEPLDGPLTARADLLLRLPVMLPDPPVPAVDLPEAVPDEQEVLAGHLLDEDVVAADGAEEARQRGSVPPCGADAGSWSAFVESCLLGHA